MKAIAGFAILVSMFLVNLSFAANGPEPAWAYNVTPPPPPAAAGATPAPPDPTLYSLPGSKFQFTRAQIGNGFGPADWYPEDHPTMPDVVAQGRKPQVRACGLCHYPNGKGRSENAGVADLPVAYFIQQLNDFKNDNRASADPGKANTKIMIQIAKNMTDDEMKAAAEYFAQLKWTPWVKVVETDTVPKTRGRGGMFLPLEGNEKEPIANRLIEVPVNVEATDTLRDDHSSFIAYVPVGAIKKGEALVTKGGNGKTTQCGVCHGADLRGMGPVPPIAGRSPSYLARQLYDMQSGNRKGLWTDLMKPVVANLTNDDILNIAAYTASRPVPEATQAQVAGK